MLTQEDVSFIENELSFEDKISLIFLLYGQRNPNYALQTWTVAASVPDKTTTSFLVEWMDIAQRTDSGWEMELLEALSILEQNTLLLRVGCNDEALRLLFYPRTTELAVKVHPLLKGLYHFCERLDDANARKLAKQLGQPYGGTSDVAENCFEVVLLRLLSSEAVRLGSKTESQECDLLTLSAACKAIELYDESYFLKGIADHFNSTLTKQQHQQHQPQEQSDASSKSETQQRSLRSAVAKTEPAPRRTVAVTLERYHFVPERAGIFLLVNQFSFHRETNPELSELLPAKPLRPRKGTAVDKKALEELFTRFGYEMIVEENITHLQILQSVSRAVQKVEPTHCSLVVCLLSHGQEGKVYGTNSIPVEVKAIQSLMANERVTGKPKLLIVQACQGSELQSAVPIPRYEHDGAVVSKERTASVYMDFLVAWSTVPGFASVRHVDKGSWFIQELCTKMQLLYQSEHFADILTAVIDDVSSKRGYGNECMVPIVQSTLSKKLYFTSQPLPSC
ncbi:caspase long class, Dredd [Anopheles darlingi]|uniref:Caspase long class, Dredd n=1 Tax=Anopheles darlingi TaxID=43151 RepID=W5JJK4_ANODA|nr:caspase long class, Dredd [Anopheles darlingi]